MRNNNGLWSWTDGRDSDGNFTFYIKNNINNRNEPIHTTRREHIQFLIDKYKSDIKKLESIIDEPEPKVYICEHDDKFSEYPGGYRCGTCYQFYTTLSHITPYAAIKSIYEIWPPKWYD